MHPQTLRKYERFGLITPSRTIGMLRLYSEEDIARLRLIKHLVDDLSLNLAGVELALGMVNYLMTMKRYLEAPDEDELRNFMEQRLEEMFALLNTEFP
ncbi:MAG: MerR family transcriptional regulator [Chloroflexi bacterium]|nr:MerR family transcriptional regulator [Chloroflexota bacterium]